MYIHPVICPELKCVVHLRVAYEVVYERVHETFHKESSMTSRFKDYMNWVMFKVAAKKTFFIFFMKATRRKLYFRSKKKTKNILCRRNGDIFF